MDFIKTSSLRALIELTFQRNWNGFIWMSRKGVIAKRVKAAPDGHIENQRRTRSPAGRGTNVPRSAKTVSVRLKSRPKSKTTRPITHHDPGNLSPRSATPQRHAAHDQSARAGEVTPRGRATHSRTTHEHPSDPGNSRVRPRFPSANLSARPQPADREIIRPRPFRPIVPTDRPNAAVDPKPFLKPNPHNSSPKPAPT
ncbi:unnamed protein product [Microthlaspi erraticum]|uniref:Uncharacterized protein n=1 Tax=Microthlaspi erraticum TaxID=1685480 RepID=A0A6D2KRG2_9BRAS|nr:unnamed protein product [Microthlaspi erraticum]